MEEKEIWGKKGESLYCAALLIELKAESWECQDCAVLDEDEYFEKLQEWHSKEG